MSTRARALLALGLALVTGGFAVVAAAVLVPALRDEAAGGVLGSRARDTGNGALGEVRTTSYTGGRHLPGGVDYRENPPMGGAHADVWHVCGVFDSPIYDESGVHSLEHGTVWITHDPDLGSGDLETLEDLLPEKGILSPRDGLPGDVVITVWNAQLALEEVDAGELEDFLAEYADGHTAPEAFATCANGLEVDEDGEYGADPGTVAAVAVR